MNKVMIRVIKFGHSGALASVPIAVVFLAAALIAEDASAQQRPNVIFILADDLGYSDLSCYGATKLATPQA